MIKIASWNRGTKGKEFSNGKLVILQYDCKITSRGVLKNQFLPRQLAPQLRKASNEFSAVVVVGPRHLSKTTLLKNLFGEQFSIISLEPPDVRLAAQSDPRGFLNLYPAPVIFDEIQYAPGLLPFIQETLFFRQGRA